MHLTQKGLKGFRGAYQYAYFARRITQLDKLSYIVVIVRSVESDDVIPHWHKHKHTAQTCTYHMLSEIRVLPITWCLFDFIWYLFIHCLNVSKCMMHGISEETPLLLKNKYYIITYGTVVDDTSSITIHLALIDHLFMIYSYIRLL